MNKVSLVWVSFCKQKVVKSRIILNIIKFEDSFRQIFPFLVNYCELLETRETLLVSSPQLGFSVSLKLMEAETVELVIY